jgi:hypothetical protein
MAVDYRFDSLFFVLLFSGVHSVAENFEYTKNRIGCIAKVANYRWVARVAQSVRCQCGANCLFFL